MNPFDEFYMAFIREESTVCNFLLPFFKNGVYWDYGILLKSNTLEFTYRTTDGLRSEEWTEYLSEEQRNRFISHAACTTGCDGDYYLSVASCYDEVRLLESLGCPVNDEFLDCVSRHVEFVQGIQRYEQFSTNLTETILDAAKNNHTHLVDYLLGAPQVVPHEVFIKAIQRRDAAAVRVLSGNKRIDPSVHDNEAV
jgi:hypothetical protein